MRRELTKQEKDHSELVAEKVRFVNQRPFTVSVANLLLQYMDRRSDGE